MKKICNTTLLSRSKQQKGKKEIYAGNERNIRPLKSSNLLQNLYADS